MNIITIIFSLSFFLTLGSCGEKPIDNLASAKESIKTASFKEKVDPQIQYPEGSVEAAVVDYVQGDDKERRMTVEDVKVVGDYAKAKINFLPMTTDPAKTYLKKVDGEWEVLDFGTGVNPMELGVPEEVWRITEKAQGNPNPSFKRDALKRAP